MTNIICEKLDELGEILGVMKDKCLEPRKFIKGVVNDFQLDEHIHFNEGIEDFQDDHIQIVLFPPGIAGHNSYVYPVITPFNDFLDRIALYGSFLCKRIIQVRDIVEQVNNIYFFQHRRYLGQKPVQVVVEIGIEIDEFEYGTDGYSREVSYIDKNANDDKTGKNKKRIYGFNRHRFF
jgi:hypothetical protein